MDAIILIGGRGRRLGALTEKKQKGILRFIGKPLLGYVLDSLLTASEVNTIWIATGYRPQTVRHFIEKAYGAELDKNKIKIIDISGVTGTLSRLMASVKAVTIEIGALVLGIDSIVPPEAMHRFLKRLEKLQSIAGVLASPNLETAPTHRVLRIEHELVVEYADPKTIASDWKTHWYQDTGIRYFSKELLHKLRHLDIPQAAYVPQFITSLMARNIAITGIVFHEPWFHFGIPPDFAKRPPT